MELKKVNKTYSELLDKCEPQDQTTKTILPSTPKLKIETKAGKELKKNAPTKTEIKITKHAKVETKKSNVIIKTTQKPTIKSVTGNCFIYFIFNTQDYIKCIQSNSITKYCLFGQL